MEALAIAIFLSTILVLVDKNQKWEVFWKACGIVALLAILGIGYLMYSGDQRRHAMTPDSFMATQK